MIHARDDYQNIQAPDEQIPADEPVFLLRAQDSISPELVMRWASKLRKRGGSEKMAKLAETQAKRMVNWQKKVKIKIPDLK